MNSFSQMSVSIAVSVTQPLKDLSKWRTGEKRASVAWQSTWL